MCLQPLLLWMVSTSYNLEESTAQSFVRCTPEDAQNLLRICETSRCSQRCKQTPIRAPQIYAILLGPLGPQVPFLVATLVGGMSPSTCNNTGDDAAGNNFTPNAASTTFHYSVDAAQECTAADDGKDSVGLAELNACLSKFPADKLVSGIFES